jgi:DNA-binding transcriptional MerR regulator
MSTAGKRLKMKDLCSLTGLPRQAIHFYMQQGLLPAGHKTGRNTAYYDDAHLERLRLIRRLQTERFLPLKAIRALLEGQEEQFPAEQRAFLRAVGRELQGTLSPARSEKRSTVRVKELLSQTGVDRTDFDRLVDLGMLAVTTKGGETHLVSDDAWIVESVGKLRAAGFTKARGVEVDELQLYTQAIDSLFDQQTALMTERLAAVPPEDVARMVERALPVVHDFIVRYHAGRIREFLAAME